MLMIIRFIQELFNDTYMNFWKREKKKQKKSVNGGDTFAASYGLFE